MLVADEGTAARVESTQSYAERIGATLGRTLFQVGLAPFITALVFFVGLLRVRLGAPENLPMPRRPNHADELLGALDPFLECFAELAAKAPSDMEEVDLEQLREDRGRLLEVRELLKVLQPLMEGLQAVEAHLENRLDTPVRAVVTQLRSDRLYHLIVQVLRRRQAPVVQPPLHPPLNLHHHLRQLVPPRRRGPHEHQRPPATGR